MKLKISNESSQSTQNSFACEIRLEHLYLYGVVFETG